MRTILGDWARDLRLALRGLRRTPGFTMLAVGMLGLAMGATAGMFGVVNTVLLDPLPYNDPDRLVFIAASAPGSEYPEEFGVSSEFYVHYKERSRLLEQVALSNSFTNSLRVDDRVERIRMSAPTPDLFAALGARPAMGRLVTPEDGDGALVISDALWATWFGRDSTVLGRQVFAAGPRTIVGIMPPDFQFPVEGTLLWLSTSLQPEDIQPGQFYSDMIGRLKPGATVEELQRELTALSKELPERFGGSPSYARTIEQHRAVVRPLADQVLGGIRRPLWVLFGAAAIVLIIACANVANLFLVRAEARGRDLAVRRALGAGRAQLVRLQMAEAVVVAVLAGVVAVLLAALIFPLFLQAAPAGVPRLAQVTLDLPTLVFAVVAAGVAALACGLAPALRGASPDFGRLRDGARGSTRGRTFLRHALVVGQTALALVLLIGSGLLIRSFQALRAVDPGYETADIFTFQIAPSRPELNDGPTFARFDLQFMERLRALPGVQSVGLVENMPLDEGTARGRWIAEGSDPAQGLLLNYTFTAGDYFPSMGIAVLRGRPFEDTDHFQAFGNVVLSRTAAERLWPGQDPLGRRLQREGWDSSWATVVGVVEDVMQYGFRDEPQGLVYLPLVGPAPRSWGISSPAYVLKTARADVIAPEVRALVREVAPEAPMYRTYTMEALAERSMIDLSFTMLTLGIAALLALLLGAVGLYGVLSYVVAQRTREIGVRMALGARAAQVRAMVVAQGARVVGLGVAIGIGVALATTKALASLLFGVHALDLATFLLTSAGMVAVGLLASYLPARRASNVDPIEAIRAE
jgi:putative ABC transport system permease protein